MKPHENLIQLPPKYSCTFLWVCAALSFGQRSCRDPELFKVPRVSDCTCSAVDETSVLALPFMLREHGRRDGKNVRAGA